MKKLRDTLDGVVLTSAYVLLMVKVGGPLLWLVLGGEREGWRGLVLHLLAPFAAWAVFAVAVLVTACVIRGLQSRFWERAHQKGGPGSE